uniref:Uncharacterized protein n=1 Tax=Kwoniella bestiolae CBS 10118 TaxID=1296100 RepID=A0A1B9FY29_9TREE|nr:hypothetical protein I302_06659 [Kwoniella bestiolae CBS 10118]OCF23676.1 hypothetical protein I302_06659 [Kwoniella bestiolae CBS 10118]
MWNNHAPEGDACVKKMSEIRSVHTQIKAGGVWKEDTMLAYAMTFALHDFWDLFKQNLRLRDDLTSANVQAGVSAEAIRKGTIASANKATGQNFKNGQNGKFNNNGQTGQKCQWSEKWCSIHEYSTHNTVDCYLSNANKAKNGGNGQAHVSNDVRNGEVSNLSNVSNRSDSSNVSNLDGDVKIAMSTCSITFDTDFDGDAFSYHVYATNAAPSEAFIIDSGASHQMVGPDEVYEMHLYYV